MGHDRSRAAFRAGVLTLLLALAACGGAAGGAVTGAVTAVDGDLDDVESFTLRTSDGDDRTFVPADDGEFAFPLPHLRDHLQSLEPVTVEWEERDGIIVAVRISDG